MIDRAHKLTPAMVAGLWEHMAETYDFRVVEKHDAAGMKLIGNFLDLMKIMDREKFLEDYATTVGHLVCPNFKPGVVVPGGRGLASQVRVCGHETRHVALDDEEGLAYSITYLADHSARALFELQCLQVSQEIHFFLYDEIPDPDEQAGMLLAYNCTKDDVRFVAKGLRSSARTVKAGGMVRKESAYVCNYLRQAGL